MSTGTVVTMLIERSWLVTSGPRFHVLERIKLTLREPSAKARCGILLESCDILPPPSDVDWRAELCDECRKIVDPHGIGVIS